ncbi:sugar phosphate isomerase/epimerase family protein [Maribacter sp. 2210JD10-5]|uniref:sugar phosphate isomerase/epimerase family protein n=1 Tax=Maribacter sp. 2210JD10-5 TaxID=3386272 RepID=UPI0039BD923A
MKKKITRRNFIGKTALVTAGAGLGISNELFSKTSKPLGDELNIHVFSKHLQFLNYNELAQAAAEIGFQGVDLSVRPKGHVLPQNVAQDLPLAVQSLKKVGFDPVMMTSGITDVDDVHTRNVLKIAADQGIRFYRLGYYHWTENGSILEDLRLIKRKVEELAKLNELYRIKGAFQNHAGSFVGASIYEVHNLLEGLDNKFMGCQYDIRHASVEGAQAWPTQLRLIAPKINTIVIKDYKWSREGNQWKLMNVPIGEGMVNFHEYFKMLKKHKINVPVSMHFEYDLGGAEHGMTKINIDQKEVFKAMRRDLKKVQDLWKMA